MFLNADIPRIYAFVRAEYLYDLQSHHGEVVPCCIYRLTSLQGKALLFDCLLENGANIGRLPISAFCHTRYAQHKKLEDLQLWNCFSYEVAVHEATHLSGLRCAYIDKQREWHEGVYLFTVDWCGNEYAEDAGDGGWKNAHVIKLDNGNFCAQPNNRLRFYDPCWVTKPFPERPDYLTNTHVWNCETKTKWATSDDKRMFYEVNGTAHELAGEL